MLFSAPKLGNAAISAPKLGSVSVEAPGQPETQPTRHKNPTNHNLQSAPLVLHRLVTLLGRVIRALVPLVAAVQTLTERALVSDPLITPMKELALAILDMLGLMGRAQVPSRATACRRLIKA